MITSIIFLLTSLVWSVSAEWMVMDEDKFMCFPMHPFWTSIVRLCFVVSMVLMVFSKLPFDEFYEFFGALGILLQFGLNILIICAMHGATSLIKWMIDKK